MKATTLTMCHAMLFAALAAAAAGPSFAEPAGFFRQHCVECHDADAKAGGLDLTSLRPEFDTPEAFATWVKVHDRIESGEMPPPEEPRPAEADRLVVVRALKASLDEAERRRPAYKPRTGLRRLTRAEYENTIRDLFDLPGISLRSMLPPDGSAQGFDKNSDALDISHVHMRKYIEAADQTLDMAVAMQPTPPATKAQRISLACRGSAATQGLMYGDGLLLRNKQPDPAFSTPDGFYHIDQGAHERMGSFDTGAAVGQMRAEAGDFKPLFMEFVAIYPARYRVRTSLWSFQWDKGKMLPSQRTEVALMSTVHLTGDGRGDGHPRTVLRYLDAPSWDEQVHEFTVWFNNYETIGFNTPTLRRPLGSRNHEKGLLGVAGPGVACDFLEVEGPLYESWPPPSHKRLFGELPIVEFKPAEHPGERPPKHELYRQKMHHARNVADPVAGVWTVHSQQPLADADRLLADFLPLAFRRPVPSDVRQAYVAQVAAGLEAGDCFETAMRRAYRIALCSPEFLYHIESTDPERGVINDHALAGRLSYFLWNSMPDERLVELAAANTLHKSAVLAAEVERMLASPKSQQFVEDFLGQWLKLRSIAATDPDKKLYPEFDAYLQESMVSETRAYFRELLDRDLHATHLVKSDFAIINGRLAAHYGIEGVQGSQVRRVAVPTGSPRGPFLTQASILKITANGTVTSPVPRGAFVMDRLLGRPPEPPPSAVPAIEPDVRGATTIREQLAKHSSDQNCAGCHAKFDPAGFALESFDVIGGQRTRYRAIREGSRLDKDDGPAVDPSGTLQDGQSFQDVLEFQELIAREPKQLLTSLAKQFLVYSTGRPVTFSDRDQLHAIVTKTAAQGGGVRTLIREIVQSDLFRTE